MQNMLNSFISKFLYFTERNLNIAVFCGFFIHTLYIVPNIHKSYSTMPRPLEPVERAAFFSECTLAGLRPCINQPYCTLADNAPETNYAPNVPHIKKTTP